MCINLHFEKVMENGEPCIKITEVKALPRTMLPRSYLQGRPCCIGSTQQGDRIEIWLEKQPPTELKKGGIILEEDFLNVFNQLRKCGKRLKKINKKNRRRIARKDWQGIGKINL